MGLKTWPVKEHRLGVLGLYESGKTVLLTSLIDHLKYQEPDRFSLGKEGKARIRKFQENEPDPGSEWERFRYARYRDALAHGQWPPDTSDRLQYACEFQRTDRNRWQRLKFYDFPGERIADIGMYKCSYEAWSQSMIKRFEDDRRYRDRVREYLNLQKEGDIEEGKVVYAYKKALARLACAYKPLISPSVFLLDVSGNHASTGSVEEIAEDRCAGLDEDRQFAPLGKKCQEENRKLSRTFAARYDEYRKKIVRPWVKGLKKCHGLAVLVDVTMVLSGGTGMYDDNQALIRELLRTLEPNDGLLLRNVKALSRQALPSLWCPGGISKIAFVASKSDKVHPLDMDNYKNLMRTMVERDALDLDHVKTEYLTCSAAISTDVVEKHERTLCGFPATNGDNGREADEKQKFEVSKVPHDWPREWEPGEYSFPNVRPVMIDRKDYPPNHENLDKLFNFLTH
ncbi:MAG: YcjX family protein [Candidatus Brocadiia bacterium]